MTTARDRWLSELQSDPAERRRREQSDFLAIINDAGESFDFHCLRHSTASWLALSGAGPKEMQTILRHSDVNLTLGRYAHLMPQAEATAAVRMAGMFTPEDEGPIVLRATGTADHRPHDEAEKRAAHAQRQAQQLGRETSQAGAKRCESDNAKSGSRETHNPKLDNTLCERMPADTVAGENAPCWTRTNNLLIKSQLLCQLS
jgi:hypothetical protein